MDTEDTKNTPLTTKEAAAYLSVSENQLSIWRKKETGPKSYQPSGPNGKRYYYKKDLDDWIKTPAKKQVKK